MKSKVEKGLNRFFMEASSKYHNQGILTIFSNVDYEANIICLSYEGFSSLISEFICEMQKNYVL